ncbi:ComEC/Rec2 family competence protein [Ammoniphilus sp. YIM 78166]|uniref:ComEC/Rec2 family competence protein n=1 Tax=Ammoniphilus sp. YIM 78166 TaxID=1644106 RepID=UPI00106F7DF2|nr:hypothetical protein [Ammoniphilus sp. YIM 78166]
MLRFFFHSILFGILMTILSLYLLLQYLHFITDARTHPIAKSYDQTVVMEEQDMLLHFINLNQGKSIMIQISDRAILIDAGHKEDSEQLLSYIHEHGVMSISEILLSNPAPENISGLTALLATYPSAKVYVPALTKDLFRLDHIPLLLTLRTGDHLVLSENKKIELEILAPERPLFTSQANNSLVGLLRYEDLRILLANDIDEEAEARLVERHPMLRAHILTVPDRPSSPENDQSLLKKLSPQAAVMLELPCPSCKELAQKTAQEYAQEWSDFFFVPIGKTLLLSFHNGTYITPKEQ